MYITKTTFNRFWFYSITILLFIQYIRPQDLVGGPLKGLPLFLPVAGIVFLFFVISKEKYKILNFSQIRIILLFLLWTVLFIPFSQSPNRVIKGLSDFLPLLPFIFSVPLLIGNVEILKRMINTLIILMVFISIVGLATGGGRYNLFGLGNFLTDPNDFSLYMVFMLPFCFFMFLYEKRNKIIKLCYAIATLLSITSIIISYSRGGFLGMLCVILVMWFFSPNRKLTASVGAIILVGIMLFSSTQWKEVASSSFDTQQSTAQTRLTTWKVSLRVFVNNPLGIGMYNIPNTMYKYADAWENPERWWGDVNHSFWLTFLAEGGIIGFCLVMVLLFQNFRDSIIMTKIKPLNDDYIFMKYLGYSFIGSLIGFCASSTFLTVSYYPHIWYITTIIAAASRVMYNTNKTFLGERI